MSSMLEPECSDGSALEIDLPDQFVNPNQD